MIRAHKVLLGVALLLVAALAVAGPAAAKDRNNDRIPDRWEKKHDLSLKVKQTHRDQDRDGLQNLGEYRSGSDPRNADSDDDGTEDGDENAGVITAFDGTTLTIDLYGGGTITGTVDESTEVKCGNECGKDGPPRPPAPPAEGDDDGTADQGSGDDGDHHGGPRPRHPGNSGPGSENSGDQGDECSVEDLAVDVIVHEAEIKIANGTAVFKEIELAKE